MNSLLSDLAAATGRAAHAARIGLLLVMCLFAFLPGIATLPPTDRDESRYMQASKQMVESGDYIDIRFQKEPRYLKPVGIYWMQAVSLHLLGDGPASPAWVYRLVSVFSMTAAVLTTYFIGLRFFGPAAGFLAAIAMIGLVIMGFEARIAKTDAALMAATTMSMAALGLIYVAERTGGRYPAAAPWVFWIAQGVGVLIKGPITPLAAGLAIVALSFWDRDWRWLKKLRPGPGLLVMALVVAPWLIAITIKSGTVFWTEALDRSLFSKVRSGQESHGFPPGYYAIIFTLFMWPFALEILRAGLKAINVLRTDPRLAFLIAWYVPFWLVFEAIPTKLPHYILPADPAGPLLMAWALCVPAAALVDLKRWQRWMMAAATFGWGLVTLALSVLMVGLLPYVTGQFSLWGVIAAVLVVVAGWLGSGLRPPLPTLPRILAASLAGAACLGIAAQVIAPSAKPLWLGERIAEAFEAHRPCPDSILISSGFLEPSLVFLAGTNTQMARPAEAAQALAASPACGIAAVRDEQRAEFFAALPGGEPSVEAVAEVKALDYTKGVERIISLYRVKAR